MTDSPAGELIENVKRDISETGWRQRVQTLAITVGVLAFGVALGVRLAAVDTINLLLSAETVELSAPTMAMLADSLNQHMRRFLAVALVALVAGTYLEVGS